MAQISDPDTQMSKSASVLYRITEEHSLDWVEQEVKQIQCEIEKFHMPVPGQMSESV